MTVHEKMKEVFGIAFKPWYSGDYSEDMIDCLDVRCEECPLNNNCNGDGVTAWLESEYQEDAERKGDENNQTKTKEYQKGFEDGKAQVINDLSKIFSRR